MSETLRQLSAGRHGLSRDQVVASQRSRMMIAVAETMMERGYAGTPVAEVIRRAGVSRETFYQQFRSKQDCFIQALDGVMEIMTELLDAAPDAPESGPIDRFRERLRVYLRTLSDEPAWARVFLVEVYAAGPEAIERRQQQQHRFADAIAANFKASTTEQLFACRALVAATAQMVTTCLVAGDLDGIRALEEPLVKLAERLLT